MILTLGGEVLGVFGVVGAGAGGGVWIDTRTFESGPFLYLLAGTGLGAYAGMVLELGVYPDREALRGRAMELGAAGGTVASVGGNTSLGGPRVVSGAAADLGVGGGLGAWALASLTWVGVKWPFWRR